MRGFLAMLLRCVLVLGLGFAPVANALNMAAMAAGQEDHPPCHAPAHHQHHPDGKCCGTAHQCHCAMATAIPTSNPVANIPAMLTDHPQTVLRLTAENTTAPDTPPPRRAL